MANVSKLLHGSKDSDDLLTQLQPSSEDNKKLNDAKQQVREHLRKTFNALGRTLGEALTPHFFTQGSAAYKTLNRPAHTPPQQMDLDDGTYLPMSTLRTAPKPSAAAEAYFAVVDRSLQELVKQNPGWKFDTRPTCARIIIDKDAHIDVPLYAIPDDQYEQLAKAARMQGVLALDGSIDFMEARRRPDNWDLLPSDKVFLAHREEDWKVSDPRKIHAWVMGTVDLYGEQFRRECRYLKAWRDHHRPTLDSLSSILLMTCVWKVYDEIGHHSMPTRDDLALEQIADRLPNLLNGPIYNETDKNERLDARLTPEQRRDAVAMAKNLKELVGLTVKGYSQEIAVDNMRKAFGPRIPLRPDLVVVERAAATVLKTAPTIVAAPNVGRSLSG